MTTWTFTFTIPVGLLLRLAAAWVAVGVLLAFPADRTLWRLYVRRGYRKTPTYRAWVASRASGWYGRTVTGWPRVIAAVALAAYRVDRMGR